MLCFEYCRYTNGHIFVPDCAKYSLNQIECPDLTHIFDLVQKQAYNSTQFFLRCKGTPQNTFEYIFQCIFFNTGRDRWFNIGIQPKKYVSENLILAEMTFNCHRGYCLITKQYPKIQEPPLFVEKSNTGFENVCNTGMLECLLLGIERVRVSQIVFE